MAIHGILVPLVTPFDADGRIAGDALQALAADVLEQGASGIVALGTTAEAAALDAAERQLVVDLCAEVCRERDAPLVVGAGSADTRASEAALADLARWPEISAALVPVPSFSRPGEAGVVAHFAHLAAAGPVPLIVYHVPYRTAQPLGTSALRELAALPNVAGAKYATGSLDGPAVDLLADPPPGFALLAGDDVTLSPLLALGAAGGVLASAHLATRHFAALAAAWADGDAATARPLGHRLARLSAACFTEPNPTVLKAALHALGRIPTPDVRLPLLPAAPASVNLLHHHLAALP
ncbi:dihydrodipicolinate synthase family protein [Actinocorallia sp. API 0066]|uniref:dihydrodipicolinate synthase family protein n=1 Tax=Actinocorallia sp. API 0066 TaxID=2896846 RepID=UPI001E2B77BA|nr:dihydrodipicolinate synthase family protein [Actinocorallia sp. API 0066]MCD0447850.1 dihydrodipicolinate synthase family protein [Actinocorallia sp. API 0066]